MKRSLLAASLLSIALCGAASAQTAPSQLPSGPTKPPSSRPPSGSVRPPRPPSTRPPYYRHPNPWRRPTASQWYWHGRWVGRVHAAAFVYPPGYDYRRWYRGDRLPEIFLTPTYFYTGAITRSVAPPRPGYRWVRYGPDLLLVDMATRRVEDVAYGVFF